MTTEYRLPVILQELPALRDDDGGWMSQDLRQIAHRLYPRFGSGGSFQG